MKEEKEDKVAVISRMPNFAVIPIDLIRDKGVSLQAKALYAIFHSYSGEKRIQQGSLSFVSYEKIARENTNCSSSSICRYSIELRKKGWTSIIRVGQGQNNITILHAVKNEEISKEDKKLYLMLVKKNRRKQSELHM